MTKQVVSISLGSSRRDKESRMNLLGQDITLARKGTDGSLEEFGRLFGDLDGKADCLGVGGADVWLVAGGRRYAFREIERLVSRAKTTPVVDGSGLKHTLERDAVAWLQQKGVVDFAREKVLLVSAVDRFGMAEALSQACPSVVYGDLCFAVGLPLPIRRFSSVRALGRLLLPVVTRLPFRWFYPTGPSQDARKPKFTGLFEEATLIAGDWHYIRRFAPDSLRGKTILTQTLRSQDLEWLRSTGAARAITTTPEIDGETFATNVMEATLVAVHGRRLNEDELRSASRELNWIPSVFSLQSS